MAVFRTSLVKLDSPAAENFAHPHHLLGKGEIAENNLVRVGVIAEGKPVAAAGGRLLFQQIDPLAAARPEEPAAGAHPIETDVLEVHIGADGFIRAALDKGK
jgi:hypothetical protein